MLYDAYKSKMQKAAKIRRRLKKFRVPIIVALVLLVGALSTFLALKGTVTTNVSLSKEVIYYGDDYELNDAKALLGGIKGYEYREANNGKWSKVKPTTPGTYQVRALGAGAFGTRKGKTVQFSILPRTVELQVRETQVVYGDMPHLIPPELVGNDKLDMTTAVRCVFDDVTVKETKVTPDIDSICVRDASGKDITDYYTFVAKTTDITFAPKTLSQLTPQSPSFTFSGQPLVYENKPADGYALPYDAYIVFDTEITDRFGNVYSAENSAHANALYAAARVNAPAPVVDAPVTMVSGFIHAGEYTVCVIEHSVHVFAKNKAGEEVDLIEAGLISRLPSLAQSTFTVARKTLHITVASSTKEYDGAPLSAKDIEKSDGLAAGQNVKFRDDVEAKSITDVRQSRAGNNSYAASDFIVTDANGATSDGSFNLTDDYFIRVTAGTLAVTARPVTVTTATDDGFIYDGTYHYNNTLQGNGFPDGYNVSTYRTIERKDAGSIPNAYTQDDLTVTDGRGYAVDKNNFTFTVVTGTLTVRKREVAVTPIDTQKPYDGKSEHTLNVECRTFVDGEQPEFAGVFATDPVAVGNYLVTGVTAKSGNALYNASNYEIKFDASANAYLRITGAPLSIVTQSDWNHIYDGKPYSLTEPAFVDGLMANHELRAQDGYTTVTDCNGDGVQNTVVYKIFVRGTNEEVTGNYFPVTTDYGTLRVLPKTITVETAGKTKPYDGTPLTNYNSRDDYFAVGLIDGLGHTLVLDTARQSEFASITDVAYDYDGKTVIGIKNMLYFYVQNADGSVCGNYTIDYGNSVFGELKITPRPVIVTTGSDSRAYNGLPLSKDTHTGESYLVTGHGLQRTNDLPAITNKGEQVNTQIFAVVHNGRDVTKNYAISYEYGTLTVTERTVYIHSVLPSGITYYGDTLPKESWTYAARSQGDADVQFVQINGVTETPIYNNAVYTLNGITAVRNENGHLDADTYGVGYGGVKDFGDNGFIASNYNIVEQADENAELTVTPRPVRIAFASFDAGAYDGQAHKNRAGWYWDDTLGWQESGIWEDSPRDWRYADDTVLRFVDSEQPIVSWRYAGQNYGETTPVNADTYNVYFVSANSGKNGYKATNYAVAGGDPVGTVMIQKRKVAVKAKSFDAGEYDGQAHTHKTQFPSGDDYECINGTSFVGTEMPEIVWRYEGQNYGETTPLNADVYDTYFVSADSGKNGYMVRNYDISNLSGGVTEFGTVTVQQRKVAVKAKTFVAGEYDGQAHTHKLRYPNGDDYECISGNFIGNEMPEITWAYYGAIWSVTTAPVHADVYTTILTNVAEEGKNGFLARNYMFENLTDASAVAEFGTLTVQARNITVKADDITHDYDGTAYPHTGLQYGTVAPTSFVAGEKLAVTWTFMQNGQTVEAINAGVYDIVKYAHDDNTADGKTTYATDYSVANADEYGKLTVNKRTVFLIITNNEKTYDGKAYDHAREATNGTPWEYSDGTTNEHTFVEMPRFVWLYNGSEEKPVHADTYVLSARIENGEPTDDGKPVFDNDNYIVSVANGTLTVNSRTVAILPNVTKTYDGTEDIEPFVVLPDSLYVWAYPEADHSEREILPQDYAVLDFVWTYADTMIPHEDVQKYRIYLRITERDGRHDYVFVAGTTGSKDIIDGYLTVTPRTVHIVATNSFKTYDGVIYDHARDCKDGAAWRYVENTESEHKFVDAQTPAIVWGYTDAARSATPKDAGKYGIVFADISDDAASGFKIKNYDITTTDGMLTIDKRAVYVRADDQTKIYDGIEDNLPQITYTTTQGTSFVNGEVPVLLWRYDVSNAQNVTPVHVALYAIVFDGAQDNLPFKVSNYAIQNDETRGILTITQRTLTVTAHTIEMPYDGKEHAHTESDYTCEGLAGDEKPAIVWNYIGQMRGENEALNADVYAVAQLTISDHGANGFVLRNYAVAEGEHGTLTVKARAVKLVLEDTTKVYDKSNTFPETLFSAAVGSDGFVDTQRPVFDWRYEDESGNVVSLPVNVGVYTLAWGDDFTDIVRETGENGFIKSNYVLSADRGATLTITKRKVFILSKSATFVYDGKEHYADGYVVANLCNEDGTLSSVEGIVSGDTVRTLTYTTVLDVMYTESGAVTDIENKCTYTVDDGNGGNNYEITFTFADKEQYGTLAVTRRPVTFTSATDTKVYDGEAFAHALVSAQPQGKDVGLIEGHTFTVGDTRASIIDVADSAPQNNTFTLAGIFDGKNDVTKNYAATCVFGTLTVERRHVTVASEGQTFVYDGQEHTLLRANEQITAQKNSGLLTNLGHVLTAADGTKVRNVVRDGNGEVASVRNIVTCKITAGVEDVTANYLIDNTTYAGMLTVTPRPVTVESESHAFVYNGSYQRWEKYTVEPFDEDNERGLISGHSHSATFVAVRDVTAGTDNVFEITIYDEYGNTVTENYVIDPVYGTLVVTQSSVVVTPTGSKIYDGTDTIVITDIYGADYTGEKFAQQPQFVYEYVQKEHNGDADTYVVRVTPQAQETAIANYPNYAITFRDGTFTVHKRTVYVAPTGRKIYNGNSSYAVDVTYTGMSAFEGSEYRFVGEQMPDFTVAFIGAVNAGTHTIAKENVSVYDSATCKVQNYDIRIQNGAFTVEPRPLSVRSQGATKVYNGAEQWGDGYDLLPPDENSGLVNGHIFAVTGSTKVQNVTGDAGVPNIVTGKITDASGEDVTGNYAIDNTTYAGTLIVTPRPVTFTSATDGKTYDGEAFAHVALTPSGDESDPINSGLVAGHTFAASDRAVIRNVRDTAMQNNTFSVSVYDGTQPVTGNYVVTRIYGTLTVSRRGVTVSPESGAKYYDGTENYTVPVTVGGDGFVNGEQPLFMGVYDASILNAGTYSITGLSVMSGSNAKFAADNYTIAYTGTATLAVRPRPITLAVTVTNATVTYSGAALPANGYDFASAFDRENGDVDLQGASTRGIVAKDIAAVRVSYEFYVDNGGVWTQTEGILHAGTYEIRIASVTGLNGNYTFASSSVAAARITVEKRPVTIRLLGGNRLYNGDATSYADIVAQNGGQWYTPVYGNTVAGDALYGDVTVQDIASFITFDGNVYNADNSVHHRVTGASSVTDAAQYTVKADARMQSIFHADYNVSVRSNTYAIEKLALAIANESDIKPYTGTDYVYGGNITWENVQASEDVRAVVQKLIETQNVTLAPQKAFTARNAGKHYNRNSITVLRNGEDFSYNFVVSVTEGVIEITPVSITVNVQAQSAIYSGEPFAPAFTATGLLNGHRLQIRSWIQDGVSLVHAGTYEQYEADGYDVFVGDNNYDIENGRAYYFRNNYAIEYGARGMLEITKRHVVVSPSGIKAYNGEDDIRVDDLYPAGTAQEHMFVSGEEPMFTYEYTLDCDHTQRGTYGIRVADTDTWDALLTDYEVIWQDGTLTVGKRSVYVSLSGEKTYDGKPIGDDIELAYAGISETEEEYRFLNGQFEDVRYSYDSIAGKIDAGTYTLQNIAFRKYGSFDPENYDITVVKGSFTVKARKVTVVTGDAIREEYDGKELFTEEVYEKETDAENEGLLDGHVLQVGTVRKITNVSQVYEKNNTTTVKIVYNGTDIGRNYSVVYERGTLTVKPRIVYLAPKDAEKVYDGKDDAQVDYIIASGPNGKANGWVDGETPKLVWSYTGGVIPKDVGVYTLDGEGAVRWENNGKFIARNYDIRIAQDATAKLTVKERCVRILPEENNEKVFDGTENCTIVCKAIDIDNETYFDFVAGEVAKVVWKFDPLPAIYPNTYAVTFAGWEDNGAFKAKNYILECAQSVTVRLVIHNKISLVADNSKGQTIYDDTDKMDLSGGKVYGRVADGSQENGASIADFTFAADFAKMVYTPFDGTAQTITELSKAKAHNAGTYVVYFRNVTLSLPGYTDAWLRSNLQIQNETDTNGLYSFTYTVNKRKAGIRPKQAEVDFVAGRYSYFLGTVPGAERAAEYEVIDGDFATGHTFTVVRTSALSLPSSYAWINITQYTLTGRNGEDVSDNYEIVTSDAASPRKYQARLSFVPLAITVERLPVAGGVTQDNAFAYRIPSAAGEDDGWTWTEDDGEWIRTRIVPAAWGWGTLLKLQDNGSQGVQLFADLGCSLLSYIELTETPGVKRNWLKAIVTDGNGENVSGLFRIQYVFADSASDRNIVTVTAARLTAEHDGNAVTKVTLGGTAVTATDGYYALYGNHRLRLTVQSDGTVIATVYRVTGDGREYDISNYERYYALDIIRS